MQTFERLRKLLRDNGLWQIMVCLLLGLIVGSVTLLLHKAVLWFHRSMFVLPISAYLSSGAQNHFSILLVPMLGGLCLGIFRLLTNRRKKREVVDPIEANAEYGGRMSVRGSMHLVISTLLSNAAGASVGMEAAYTQMGASFFSWVGKKLHLRREDLRIFVAAGAAAAIAAAFNAPLAGAFYGFELVLGGYTIDALSQVSAAVLAGVLFLRITNSENAIFSLPQEHIIVIPLWQYPLFILLGVGAAIIGILAMKMVTRCEHSVKTLPIPDFLRPMLGGLLLSLIALFFPQVLGNGQGAINEQLRIATPLFITMALLLAKMAGSAISIGMGFRGGLFSSSLLLGCLYGQCIGILASYLLPETSGQMTIFMLVGMGAVGASIIGAPVCMTMLVLEMTSDFTATTGVLAGVLTSSAITRYFFGYSFSTWRFHLRGLPILSAHDIGWVKDIIVGNLMSTDATIVPGSMTLPELRTFVPLGNIKYIFVANENGRYEGIIDTVALYTLNPDKEATQPSALSLAIGQDFYLTPSQHIRSALKSFAKTQMEALPVVKSADDRSILGYVSESFVLHRYAQELESRNLGQYAKQSG